MEERERNGSFGALAMESRFLRTNVRNHELDRRLCRKAWSLAASSLADGRRQGVETEWNPKEYHWVVKIGGEIVGEVDLLHDSRHTAQLRRLRIDPAWQRTAALSRLVECIRQFCKKRGRLQLTLNPGCAPRWMLHVLKRGGLDLVDRRPTVGPENWKRSPRWSEADLRACHLSH